MTDHARIGRALLSLSGHRAYQVRDLTEGDWAALDDLAGEHRLRPFLHGRRMRGELPEIPAGIASIWQEAHRANAMIMLVQRRALLQAVDTLRSRNIECVALKGSALAWTVWAAPAERVMRDIDLLVAEEDGPAGYKALREAGWKAPELSNAELEGFAERETHFPPLHSPDSVMCELHAHAWGRPPLPGSPMPRRDDEGLLERARPSEALGAAIPGPEDMLAHLVVHAACAHLLNVGPLALVDIDLWCAAHDIDWPAFWACARRDDFERPAALVMALVDRWQSAGFFAATQCPLEVEDPLLDDIELLLVQSLDARKDVSVIASVAQGRLGGRIDQHPLDHAEAGASPGSRAAQLMNRARSVGESLISARVRRDGMATAKLQRWMEG